MHIVSALSLSSDCFGDVDTVGEEDGQHPAMATSKRSSPAPRLHLSYFKASAVSHCKLSEEGPFPTSGAAEAETGWRPRSKANGNL